jgi:hypothetical protein
MTSIVLSGYISVYQNIIESMLAKVSTIGYDVSRILKPLHLCITANLIYIDIKELCLTL